MGWILLTLLTTAACFGSVGMALETRPRGRAELWIAVGLFFSAMTGVPVLALGYAGVLWPWSLGVASATVSAVVIAVLARRRGFGALIEGCMEAVRDLARLPAVAFVESWRARSLAFPGLIVTAAFLVAALVLTYLIEFCRWDDAIYHTPIIGWSIQNHGFAIVDFPKPGVGGTNGYPRLGEALCLWFVVFTDKSLIELPATLYAPLVMLVTYGLSRRFVDRVCAMGLAVVLLLVPHSWRQFCSTYVDMEMAFFLLAATYYGSREVHRRSDTAMATLAMALAAATKTTWLMFVPPVALAVYVRRLLDRSDPTRTRRDDLVAIALSMAAIAVGGAPCIARNWIHYDNPVWPVAYDVPALGIHWPGIFTPADYRGHDPAVTEGFDVPKGGMHDVMRHGYGMAVMWVGVPLAALALLAWLLSLARDLAARRRVGEAVRSFAPVVLPTLFWLATGPNFGQPRYNLHVIAAVLVACAWLFRGIRRRAPSRGSDRRHAGTVGDPPLLDGRREPGEHRGRGRTPLAPACHPGLQRAPLVRFPREAEAGGDRQGRRGGVLGGRRLSGLALELRLLEPGRLRAVHGGRGLRRQARGTWDQVGLRRGGERCAQGTRGLGTLDAARPNQPRPQRGGLPSQRCRPDLTTESPWARP
jgi:TRAP-type C4-dicarboxylate transport system permease small subunit